METKKCSKCCEIKEEDNSNFHFRKERGYFATICRACCNERKNKSRQKRKAKMTKKELAMAKMEKEEYDKVYYIAHAEDKKKHNSEYYKNNKSKIIEAQRVYIRKNRIAVNEAKQKWKKENHKKVSESGKKYSRVNRERIQLRVNERRANDIQYRISGNLRSRLRRALAGNAKVGSAVRDLGCSIEELKQRLGAQFYRHKCTGEEMSWDNYGLHGWHIDHVKPLSNFDLTDVVQVLEACHYTNLQPLWAEENIRKGNKLNWRIS